MTQQQYIINRWINIIELPEQLGNISKSCRGLVVSRSHYFNIKTAVYEEGVSGLPEKDRIKPRTGNCVAPEIEERVLSSSLENPMHAQTSTSNELKTEGIIVSPGGIRSIWLWHNLERRNLRLKCLEKWAAEEERVLTESPADLDELLHRYNTRRTNQGKYCNGSPTMHNFTVRLNLCRTCFHDRGEVDLEEA